MATHTVKKAWLVDKYGTNLSAEGVRLMVEGQRGFGFGLGCIPRGREARKEIGGPMFPGPWAYAYGLCGVIDSERRGTAWQIEQERAVGKLIEARAGDLLKMDGVTYRIEWFRSFGREDRENIELVDVASKAKKRGTDKLHAEVRVLLGK